MSFSAEGFRSMMSCRGRFAVWFIIIAFGFAVYTFGIAHNPPGYYVDESALSYNAYLVSKTGAGEFGEKFPLFFQVYTGGYTQYSNPTQIYILAVVLKVFGPSILTARLTAAASVFAACLLLGFLAGRISDNRKIGWIVAVFALLTPWLFEISRLVLETFFYPMAIIVFLWSLYLAGKKDRWSLPNIIAIALSLALLTYSYTIGRLLGPMLAFGLISFVVDRKRLFDVIKVWIAFGLTLIPLFIFYLRNPDLTTRFQLIGYIKPESTYYEIITTVIVRFFHDIDPLRIVRLGDINQRHHIPDAFGSFFIGVFILAFIGLAIVVFKRWRDPWWRFIVYSLLVSVIPGSLTVDKFHTLRMIAFPVFALMLTVPALEWFLSEREDRISLSKFAKPILAVILLLTAFQAGYFHYKYYAYGPKRGVVFDASYKELYDAAVAQPSRPIYLLDNYWGPAYIHFFWYATVEGRDTKEFIHLTYGKKAPVGSVVISSERSCTDCEMIKKAGVFLFYRQLRDPKMPSYIFYPSENDVR